MLEKTRQSSSDDDRECIEHFQFSLSDLHPRQVTISGPKIQQLYTFTIMEGRRLLGVLVSL